MNRISSIAILLFTLSCVSDKLMAFDGTASITSGGKSRSFIFHSAGVSVASDLPVLFVYHGDGGSGTAIKNTTRFNNLADSENFLVVYPNADNDGNGWHRAIDQLKDVQFTSDMIDYFCSTYHIDSKRVYATGLSAGGYMTYNLAVNLPNRIAAFAPVAGNMYANNGDFSYFSSANFKPVPILHIHGRSDATVEYPDPDNVPNAWGEWPLFDFSYYGCGKNTYQTPVVPITTNVNKMVFCQGNPPGTPEVALIGITGLGHTWPLVTGFNPTQTIWDFVKAYSIAAAPTCAVIENTFVAGTIHTFGKNILSACNEPFVPRGVNYSLADDWEFPANMNGDPTHVNDELSAQIIQANPNIVRIQWYANRQAGWKPYSVADLNTVVGRFQEADIVSMVTLHDLTCSNDYTAFNSVILPWWKQQAVLDMLNAHKGYMMVNVANEFGNVVWEANQSAAQATWINHYKNVITELRSVGIVVPLVIDAPDCGQSLDIALAAGDILKTHDPLHNIIMSAHAYWYQANSALMETRANQIASASFPIILGEIANVQDATGPCSDVIPAYQNLLQSAVNHQVGWLAWTWTDDWCDGANGRRISPNGSFSDLAVYGNIVVNNPVFGLVATAVPINNACLKDALPVKLQSFEAGLGDDGKTIKLSWKVTEEVNLKEYEVQKSLNGKSWQRLGVVSADYSTDKLFLHEYLFYDSDSKDGNNYYRLKMIDHDGSYGYSNILSVQMRLDAEIVYPSPAQSFFKIRSDRRNFPCPITLISQNGEKVLTQKLSAESENVRLTEIPGGIYIVMMNNRSLGKIVVK